MGFPAALWQLSTRPKGGPNMAYTIIRNYFDKPGRGRVILRGLTLEEAQAHCGNPETSSRTATSAKAKAITRRNGRWFDSYTEAR